ncbi:peptidase M28, partial [Halobacteriales archaeon QH_10_67_13]
GRWIHRQEKYDAAVEAGAVGFVFRNHIEGTLPPTGSIGDAEGPGAIPAVGVSKELGTRLVRHCEGEVAAKLAVEARTEPTTSQNVTGVTGPETGEQILVTAHHDAHDIAEGANDNGAGSALVAEVGRLLSQVELGTTVRCVTFGAEEVGLFGSEEMAATADCDRIRAVVNLDGIGESRNLRVATHGFDALGEAFETLDPALTAGVTVDDGLVPHSDHWPFVERGVPGAMVSSDSGADRGWGHTHADTLDKLDRRDFREIAVVVAAAVARLAEPDRTTEHASPETIAERAADREDIEIDVGADE